MTTTAIEERETMSYDVVIVGAGPAGLSAAIRLKQLAQANGQGISVCVLEKGAEVGAHLLSGAVVDPRALEELIPDWRAKGAPLHTPATSDALLYLSERGSVRLPTPPQMRNHGNIIASLGLLCRWLAEQAEALGVEIYPGFAAVDVLREADGAIGGVVTGDQGLTASGERGPGWQAGMALRARQTLFAEGCRGHLGRMLMTAFDLRRDCQQQTYGLGLKEMWEIPESRRRPGTVIHTIGWPLDHRTYGGSFLYHMNDGLVALGLVVGLDYSNPYLSPYEEFQRLKHHPAIRAHLEGGRRISYGARALNEGGLQSIPQLSFPGGALIGCEAGFVNVPRIKGIHTAMKSGMTAAEAVAVALAAGAPEATEYRPRLEQTWLWEELRQARNIRPAFRWGLWPALAWSALDAYVFRGRAPWTLHHHRPDHESLDPAAQRRPIEYPKPDGVLSFDRLTNLAYTGVAHAEDQPCHLRLQNPATPIDINLPLYDAPEQRYCPAGVYEILRTPEGRPHLRINAQNCIHCKTCDIKDPRQNIVWVPPQGGEGPAYAGL